MKGDTHASRGSHLIPLYLVGVCLPIAAAYLASSYIFEARLDYPDAFGFLAVLGLGAPLLLEAGVRCLARRFRRPVYVLLCFGLIVVGVASWVKSPWRWGVLAGVAAMLWTYRRRLPSPVSRRTSFAVCLGGLAVGAILLQTRFYSGKATRADLEFARPRSVVIVFFDQTSLPMMLDETGRINASRFPAFHQFSQVSDWFVRTSSLRPRTSEAVPMMLTGKYLRRPQHGTPGFQSFPFNLFTWMSGTYEVTGFEQYTYLCPPDVCRLLSFPRGSEALRIQLADWGLWWMKSTFPARSDKLPSMRGKPFDFWRIGTHPRTGIPGQAWSPTEDHVEVAQAALRPSSRPTFHYFHFLAPHQPWQYYPSGTRYWHRLIHAPVSHPFARSLEDREHLRSFFLRYQLQIAYADRILGGILETLKARGMYEESWVVVVSDHGQSLRPGSAFRTSNSIEWTMQPDTYSVPLMIKRPYQQGGGPVPYPAELVDLPVTLLKGNGAVPPPGLDGVDLYSGGRRQVGALADHGKETLAYVPVPNFDPLQEARFYHEAYGSHLGRREGFGWGKGRSLLGRRLRDLSVGAPSSLRWKPLAGRVPILEDGSRQPAIFRLEITRPSDLRSAVVVADGRVVLAFQVPPGTGTVRLSYPLPEEAARLPSEALEVYEVDRGRLMPMVRGSLG